MSSLIESPVRRTKRLAAHTRAIKSDLTTAVKSLVETLGKAVVAVIAGRDVKTVSRWVTGQGAQGSEEQRRIFERLQIVELLLMGDSHSVVRAWFMGKYPQLDDENPAELLAEGRAREVMAAARTYADQS